MQQIFDGMSDKFDDIKSRYTSILNPKSKTERSIEDILQ